MIQTARDIETTKTSRGVDYQTARQLVISGKHKEFPPLPLREAEANTEIQNLLSYAHATQQRRTTEVGQKTPSIRHPTTRENRNVGTQTIQEDIGTQTENVNVNANKQKDIFSDPEDFFQKLKNFILEIMTSTFQKESTNAKYPLLDSAIRQHFDIDLRKETPNESKRRREIEDVSEEETTSTDEEEVLSPHTTDTTNTIQDPPIWETVEKKQVLVNPNTGKKKNSKKKKEN